MPQVILNYWAILVAALVPMVLGMLWYGPLFGKRWMAEMKMRPEDMEAMKKKAGPGYAGSMAGALIMSYVLAHFVDYTLADTATLGMQTGFWLWLGFVATTSLSAVLFENRSKMIWFINNAYNLVALTIMGAILARWV